MTTPGSDNYWETMRESDEWEFMEDLQRDSGWFPNIIRKSN